MIDLFQPLKYEISQPVPEEISMIRNSSIEKYFVNKMLCSDYIRSAEGFFRFKARNPSTAHNEYLNRKTLDIYDIAKNLHPESIIIRIDYLLNSKLMVGVYIREDLGLMIGCIRGCRTEDMSEEEFQKLWYGSTQKN
jgi:hypothetical protein